MEKRLSAFENQSRNHPLQSTFNYPLQSTSNYSLDSSFQGFSTPNRPAQHSSSVTCNLDQTFSTNTHFSDFQPKSPTPKPFHYPSKDEQCIIPPPIPSKDEQSIILPPILDDDLESIFSDLCSSSVQFQNVSASTATPEEASFTLKLPLPTTPQGSKIEKLLNRPKYQNPANAGRLAVALALEVFFGREELGESSLSGGHGMLKLLDESKLDEIEEVIKGFYRTKVKKIGDLWQKCRLAIGKKCQYIRKEDKNCVLHVEHVPLPQ